LNLTRLQGVLGGSKSSVNGALHAIGYRLLNPPSIQIMRVLLPSSASNPTFHRHWTLPSASDDTTFCFSFQIPSLHHSCSSGSRGFANHDLCPAIRAHRLSRATIPRGLPFAGSIRSPELRHRIHRSIHSEW
jgi:hypothetical protein